MMITFMGIVIIPISIICLLIRPEYLLPLTIMFSGFSGSAVIIWGDFGLQPSFFFFLLWIISCIKSRIKVGRFWKQIQKQKYLLFFIFYSTISIFFPFFYRKMDIMIMNVDGIIVPVDFSLSCITQLMYLWYAFIFMLCLMNQIDCDKISIENVKRYYLIGIEMVCAVTIYQIVCFKIGLPFDELFRQNPHGNIQGTRIYGPCIEASMLAYYLLTALPLCIRSKKARSLLLLGIVILLGIYSFSSTFLLGFGVWIIIELFILIRQNKMKLPIRTTRIIITGSIVVALVASIYSNYLLYSIEKLIKTLTSQNISGSERTKSFFLLMSAFRAAPLTGVGFGTCRGNDLLSTWFAEIGIIGMVLLGTYLVWVISQKSKVENKVAVISVWVSMFVSVCEPYNLFIWILMAMATSKMGIEEKIIDDKN